MVLLSTHRLNIPVWMVFAHFLDCAYEVFRNARDEDFSAVSCDPNNVILGFVYHMGLSVKLHTYSLYRRRKNLALTPTLPGGELPHD